MGGWCVGRDCKVRFRDLPKNGRYAVRNISLPQYTWVSDILNSEGVDIIDTSELGESKMCNKCYKKYLKHKPSEISGDKENAGINFLYCNDFTEHSHSSSAHTDCNILPLVTVNDLFYGSDSHRKCTVCLQYSDTMTLIPKRARHQLMFHYKFWCTPDTRISTSHIIGRDIHLLNLTIDLTNRHPLKEHLHNRSEQIWFAMHLS